MGFGEVHFGYLNWSILLVVFVGTTLMGHILQGKRKGMRGFFLGNKSMPYWAVGGSLIATRTSALVFIAIPAAVFRVGGNLTYAQMTIGYIVGEIIMAIFFIKIYYQEEIYSPYDFMEKKLGTKVSQLARVLWMIGAILSQGVRLLATALVLSVITGQSLVVCVMIIGLFSIIWSILGGITTVIWTDVIQLSIFLFGAMFAILSVFHQIPGGLGEILAIADQKAKLVLVDLSTDPRATYTLWVGLFAVTVFELGQNTIDQIVVQRTLCCKNVREAQKAIYFGLLGNITTYVMLFVGLGLFAFYHIHPLSDQAATILQNEPDKVFPYFIVTQMPPGLSGLIIASIFAAGISTLDSALTALSEASVNGFYRRYFKKDAQENHYLRISKTFIIFWGVLLSLMAIFLNKVQEQGLLELGLGMPGYVYGALFGIALLAFMKRGNLFGITLGTILSVIIVVILSLHGVSFFWWYFVACIVLLVVALITDNKSKLFVSERKKIGLFQNQS